MANCPQHARDVLVENCDPHVNTLSSNYSTIQSAIHPFQSPGWFGRVLRCITIDGQTPNQSHVGKFYTHIEQAVMRSPYNDPNLPHTNSGFTFTSWGVGSGTSPGRLARIREILPWTCCGIITGPHSTQTGPGLNNPISTTGSVHTHWGIGSTPPAPTNIITNANYTSCNTRAYDCDNGDCVFVGNELGTYDGDLHYPSTGPLTSRDCWLYSGCATWNCKWSKFTGQGCIKDAQGNGTYDSLTDCQNNCESRLVFEDNFRDIIKPWIDPEGGSCLHDIITCPCGWDYVQNYQPPDPTSPQQPVYTQFAGAGVCLSSDYALWESTLGSATSNSTFHGLMSPFSLPCANLQGIYNPTVGMTIEGSPTTGLGNYLAGSITNTINNVPTTHTWDKHVIVEVNPAFNSSILNPNLQVIQSTPC
jgi:hypothetical protein